jgi:hypothetical protein
MADFLVIFCIAYTLIDLGVQVFKRIPDWLCPECELLESPRTEAMLAAQRRFDGREETR